MGEKEHSLHTEEAVLLRQALVRGTNLRLKLGHDTRNVEDADLLAPCNGDACTHKRASFAMCGGGVMISVPKTRITTTRVTPGRITATSAEDVLVQRAP